MRRISQLNQKFRLPKLTIFITFNIAVLKLSENKKRYKLNKNI